MLRVVLTFFETLDSLSSGGSIILFLDFLNPLVGFFGLELRIAVVVSKFCAFLAVEGIFGVDIGEAKVFHLLNLTNNYIR